MNDLDFVFETRNLEVFMQIIKTIIIAICIYYTNFKIINKKVNLNYKGILSIGIVILSTLLSVFIRYRINFFIGIICLIFLISICFSFYKVRNSVTVTIISTAINYSISFGSIIIDFLLNIILNIHSNYVDLIVIVISHVMILILISKIRRWKYGISFIKNNIQNEYMDILVLNVGIAVVSSLIMLEANNLNLTLKIIPIIVINVITMFITIRKILQLYYIYNLITKELNEIRSQFNNKLREIIELEEENINLSKKNHSLVHKQKSLEYKLNQIILNTEISEKLDLKDRLESISREIYNDSIQVDLTKTGILQIDDMLKFLQSECDEHKITFNLQVIGNIYHMTNNLISQEELQILIADHIKDAIIAINHSDNINKSILVKLGKIEDSYGLYIYDSGIEFEKETLENLGKKPITTHINEGGSGMGFMNTFDTLRKHNASLIIEELGKPCKENFTKIIKFKFDGKNEFKVISYRNE